MQHALIIDDDRQSASLLEVALWEAGFHSIFRTHDMEEANPLLRGVHPSLIVVAPHFAAGPSFARLSQLSEVSRAPVVVTHDNSSAVLKCLGPVDLAEQSDVAAPAFAAAP